MEPLKIAVIGLQFGMAHVEGALAYGSMGLSGKCRLYLGEGGHRFYADGAWNIIHELLKK